jgi:hypothetical protein
MRLVPMARTISFPTEVPVGEPLAFSLVSVCNAPPSIKRRGTEGGASVICPLKLCRWPIAQGRMQILLMVIRDPIIEGLDDPPV